MIHCNRFHDGSFVLYKIRINGQKYSAWYRPDGTPHDAERVSRDHQTTYAVPARHVNVWAELRRIGARYVEAATPATA